MPATLTRANVRNGRPPWGCLPPTMRVLYIAGNGHPADWLKEAFAGDSAAEVLLEEAHGATEGIARLRDDAYDAVLIYHDPERLDALALIEALRAGGSDDALIVLGDLPDEEIEVLCFEVGADAYACAPVVATRTLIWLIARAVERHQLLRDNHRLAEAHQQRLRLEQDEAERAVAAQRAVIRDLEMLEQPKLALDDGAAAATSASDHPPRLLLPETLVNHYRELLRAYVIMGSGNLADELKALGELLASAGISAQQTLELHVRVLEELLDGLGSRSSRHVMTRADLLVLEVMVHLAEGYRQRYRQRQTPPRQKLLPGFEGPLQL